MTRRPQRAVLLLALFQVMACAGNVPSKDVVIAQLRKALTHPVTTPVTLGTTCFCDACSTFSADMYLFRQPGYRHQVSISVPADSTDEQLKTLYRLEQAGIISVVAQILNVRSISDIPCKGFSTEPLQVELTPKFKARLSEFEKRAPSTYLIPIARTEFKQLKNIGAGENSCHCVAWATYSYSINPTPEGVKMGYTAGDKDGVAYFRNDGKSDAWIIVSIESS